jgi:hypothetical protein
VFVTRIAGFCVMGWVLTASGSLAGPPDLVEAYAASRRPAIVQRIERLEVVDADTGAELRLTATPGGALQATLLWADLDVRKVVQRNGDFHVRIAGRSDLAVFIRSADRLRVTRAGQTAIVLLNQPDEDGLEAVQQVLAGSKAVRLFRGVFGRLDKDSTESAPGVPLDHLDAWLGVLQGEPGAVDRRAPASRGTAWRLSRVSFAAAQSCYGSYEGEVLAAWDDFSQCVDDVKWLPPMQEVCAFTWLLRVESAWFQFIACSSFPMKVT